MSIDELMALGRPDGRNALITGVAYLIADERLLIDLDAVAKSNPEQIEAAIRFGWSSSEETESFMRMKTIQHARW